MANRFWVGGTGTWDASDTTHWATSSNGAGGASVPGSSDAAVFDALSGGGTVTLNFGGTITVQAITLGAFTGTWDNSVNNNNITLSANTAFSGTGTGTRSVKLGSATYTITTTANGAFGWSWSTTTNLTFDAGTSVIEYTGAVGAGTMQQFLGGGLTYSTVKVSGARFNSGIAVTAGTIGTLNIAAACSVSFGSSITITTLTVSAQVSLMGPGGGTLTLTNAPTINGSIGSPNAYVNSNNSVTVSCASGTMSGTYWSIQGVAFSGGATFSFTNSNDNGRNSGATITAPSSGGGSTAANPLGGFVG